MRPLIVTALFLALLGMSGSAQNVVQTPPNELTRLSDPTHEVRYQALDELYKSRAQTVSVLLSNLDKLGKEPDRNSYSPLHVTLQAVAQQNVREAVPQLMGLMDYQLDQKTVDPFGFGANESYYPAARALATIGDKSVVDAVLQRITEKSANETTVCLCTWILQKCLGSELALSAMRTKLEANPDSAGGKRAMELLSKEGGYPSPPMPK